MLISFSLHEANKRTKRPHKCNSDYYYDDNSNNKTYACYDDYYEDNDDGEIENENSSDKDFQYSNRSRDNIVKNSHDTLDSGCYQGVNFNRRTGG